MKTTTTIIAYLVSIYLVIAIFIVYGVAMGFISSDANDMASNSVRFIFNLF